MILPVARGDEPSKVLRAVRGTFSYWITVLIAMYGYQSVPRKDPCLPLGPTQSRHCQSAAGHSARGSSSGRYLRGRLSGSSWRSIRIILYGKPLPAAADPGQYPFLHSPRPVCRKDARPALSPLEKPGQGAGLVRSGLARAIPRCILRIWNSRCGRAVIGSGTSTWKP